MFRSGVRISPGAYNKEVIMDYKSIVKELEEYANNMINCSHAMCSLSEATMEYVHGNALLHKIKELKEKYDGN